MDSLDTDNNNVDNFKIHQKSNKHKDDDDDDEDEEETKKEKPKYIHIIYK